MDDKSGIFTTLYEGTRPSGAVFSVDRRYRYLLWRNWSAGLERDERHPVFVLLNPSTADANQDDPTIRRCIGFARTWGFGGVKIVNLFGFRSTNPRLLREERDPVGPDNDAVIDEAISGESLVVCGWGIGGELNGRDISWLIRHASLELHVLGETVGGHPRHPLYMPKTTQAIRWRWPGRTMEASNG